MMPVMERRPHAAPVAAAAVANPVPVATLDLPREFLSFRVGGEEYAIDILKVQEIRSYEPPTRLAGAPRLVRGVLNLRGDILPVIDLRARLGVEAGGDDVQRATIVLRLRDRTIGAVVDSVSDVVALAPVDLKAPPTFGRGVEAGYVAAIGTLEQGAAKRVLIVVDIEALMDCIDCGLAAPAETLAVA